MDLDARTQARLERIKSEVDILSLLEGFGFRVRADMDREQQFPCILHGDGSDQKPSARVYPETASWHCWGCQKSRDAVSTVREAMNLGFIEAIKWLEDKFGFPPLPYISQEKPKGARTIVDESLLRPGKTFDDDASVVHSLIDGEVKDTWDQPRKDSVLPLDRATAYWDAFDRVVFLVRGKGQSLPESQGRVALEKLRLRFLEEMKTFARTEPT